MLTAKDNVDHKPGWGTAQDQLAALSTNSRHTVADLSTMSASWTTRPVPPCPVTAITDVVTAVRTHTSPAVSLTSRAGRPA